MHALALVPLLLLLPGMALAQAPSVASLDAQARASGNRTDVAERVGTSIFRTQWPVQVLGISANRIGGHTVLGMRLSGVKFHAAITRRAYIDEVVSLIDRAFAAVPNADEVDLWTEVPIKYHVGEIVSGNLAQPTWRTVFTVSALRHDATSGLGARIRAGTGVFWDQEWSRTAFKEGT